VESHAYHRVEQPVIGGRSKGTVMATNN